jgi:sensor histidine kinase regulating citrate/malate metabolism
VAEMIRVKLEDLDYIGDRYRVTVSGDPEEVEFLFDQSHVSAFLRGAIEVAWLCGATLVIDEDSLIHPAKSKLKPGEILVDHGVELFHSELLMI